MLFFGLESEENRQVDLFADTASEEKDDRLSKALDAINAKYGRGTIFHLSEGIRKPWQMSARPGLYFFECSVKALSKLQRVGSANSS